jgi:hypothetical protein
MSQHSAFCVYGTLAKVGVPVHASFCTCGAISQEMDSSDATGVFVMELVAIAVVSAFDSGMLKHEDYPYFSDADWNELVRGIVDGATEERPSPEELSAAIEYFKSRSEPENSEYLQSLMGD